MNREEISKFILNLREKGKFTRDEIAKKLKVSIEQIEKWEKGLEKPTKEMASKVKTIFKNEAGKIIDQASKLSSKIKQEIQKHQHSDKTK